jgi:hypothetical protein
VTDEQVKWQVSEARKLWRTSLKEEGFELVINGNTFTPEDVLELMINGDYFHSDASHRADLKRMGPRGEQLARALFFLSVVPQAKYIFYLDGVLTHCLREGLIRI